VSATRETTGEWYAVRTVPGAQLPQREYATEPTALGKDGKPRGKGYRIVVSLDPRKSAIEKSLSDAGFSYYMPAEKRLIRDRRRTDLWKVRRFALMVGWVFVRSPHNWTKLRKTPGVLDPTPGADGMPLRVDLMDILMLRAVEAESEVEFDRAALNQVRAIRRKARIHGDRRLQKLIDSLNVAGSVRLSVDELLVA